MKKGYVFLLFWFICGALVSRFGRQDQRLLPWTFSTAKLMLFSVFLIGLGSCNKLIEKPVSQIVAPQFYKTQADAIAAVNAVYNTLNSDPDGDFAMYGRELNLMTDNTTDNQNFSPSNTNPDVRAMGTMTFVSQNSRILRNWFQHYLGINKANIAVDRIEQIPVTAFDSPELKNRLIQEAKFVRGLLYFNLVRLWGPVPLILHDPTTVDIKDQYVENASRDSLYAQIISDLTDATGLPAKYSAADIGRPTSGAAQSLLGYVYVTLKDWNQARVTLLKVLNAGRFPGASGNYGYGLFPDFHDVFAQESKNGIEHIFSVQFGTNLGAANSKQSLSSSFTSFNVNVYPIDCISDSSVVQIFEPGDTRKGVTFYTTQYDGSSGKTSVFNNPYTPYLNKFVDYSLSPLNQQGRSGVNFPVIRYAEVLLLYAETLNELAGPTPDAYRAVDLIRERAHINDLPLGLNKGDFRDSVFLERRREFVQEGKRWFDLKRRGGTFMVAALHKIASKSAASLKDTLFPIPYTELQLNPLLKQNPGWAE
ncbi:MAG TPA: RagB/SusD family nutrient uptake outer membrane protein [Arachidicoccus sp.]|nr:RagB/SusD family nutrient uptake outer membrane protein [Arachidicoccus sp.]